MSNPKILNNGVVDFTKQVIDLLMDSELIPFSMMFEEWCQDRNFTNVELRQEIEQYGEKFDVEEAAVFDQLVDLILSAPSRDIALNHALSQIHQAICDRNIEVV